MTASQNHSKEDILQNALSLLIEQSGSTVNSVFSETLFNRIASEDLCNYSAEDIATLLMNAWEFFSSREDNSPKIRVYHPVDINQNITVVEVINDNKPFLLDSILGEIQANDLQVLLLAHPIFATERNGDVIKDMTRAADQKEGMVSESMIHIHLERMDNPEDVEKLIQSLSSLLDDVYKAVADWKPILERIDLQVDLYKSSPPPIPADEIAEAIHFLEWLKGGNFIFLGLQEYTSHEEKGEIVFEKKENCGLGLFRNPDLSVLRTNQNFVAMTPEVIEFWKQPKLLIVTKANTRTRVHRRAHMDYVGFKLFNNEGQFAGEIRIIGLFTSEAYTNRTKDIPYLRHKVNKVMSESGFTPDSHSGKDLAHVLETYPRDELFQIDAQTLSSFAESIRQLEGRPRIRVLARPDRFDRFVSILVYLPRATFSTKLRTRVGEYLKTVYEGRISAFYPEILDGPMARIHYIIGRSEGETPDIQQSVMEEVISDMAADWHGKVKQALSQNYKKSEVLSFMKKFEGAFSDGYQAAYDIETALKDIQIIDQLSDDEPMAVEFLDHPDDKKQVLIKVYHYGSPVALSQRVPILENMGFSAINERSYCISLQINADVWMHEITLERLEGSDTDLLQIGVKLNECYEALWKQEAENDGFNALVVNAYLGWRDIVILRMMARYLRQIGVAYSQGYLWRALNSYPDIARDLVAYFHHLHKPDHKGDVSLEKLLAGIEEKLSIVVSLDDDRIIRHFLNLIASSLRTNFYQKDENGQHRAAISIKFDCSKVEDLPEPRPFREIFVYSPRIEGVHLRGGMIARGGLRWSDRPQDFRTEVLGLVKAQMVKNAVIVPVGAKGGFVPKLMRKNADREEMLAEGVACYKIFISSLLDITDNLEGDDVVPAQGVIRHDGDDPYLVVAADKGTATFSDIANELSDARGFWMSDAFASGGSVGYDHKKMGITARGGWEAVKRHFREIGKDIQSEPFTAVGVGDMSGDVFGNGMLLSEKTQLIAAFDHRDIFIDPTPDVETSYTERKRLFDLGRSSWQDYDDTLLSKGGGIFPRSEKSLKLSKEAQAAIGLDKDEATPLEVMHAILVSNAELLWFGGIGTYIKAKSESNTEVGDRANDAIRINGADVNAKVIGEGANLGLTQLGRIEFAQNGGRLNTDAIDNSAGVNSSDLEVNIKIALSTIMRSSDSLTPEERAKFLADMTDEVAELCLHNNYNQTQSLSVTERAGKDDFDYQNRLMQNLESRGILDREVEYLPDDQALSERYSQGQLLTRPELSVLMAYAKNTLFHDFVSGEELSDPYLERELMEYFPTQLRDTYPDAIKGHRLRREIIATVLSNQMINLGGLTFIHRVHDLTGVEMNTIARSFIIVRDSFEFENLLSQIDALDNKVSSDIQLQLYAAMRDLLINQTVWYIRNTKVDQDLDAVIKKQQAGISRFIDIAEDAFPDSLAASLKEREALYAKAGITPELAKRLAMLPFMSIASGIISVAEKSKSDFDHVLKVYFVVMQKFNLGRIHEQAMNISVSDYYDGLALDRTLATMDKVHLQITSTVANLGQSSSTQDFSDFNTWASKHKGDIDRTIHQVESLIDSGALTVSKLSVAAGMLVDLSKE